MVRLGAQTIQNVVTYTGVIRVENRDMALLPGMTANLQVVTEDRRDVLRVANAALRFRPAGAAGAGPSPASPGPAVAADAPAAGRGGGPAQAAAFRERIETELQPTAEQSQAIAAIMQERRAGFREATAGMSEDERRAVFRKARADMIAKVAAVLDPERKAKFEAMVQSGRRRAAAGHARPRLCARRGRPAQGRARHARPHRWRLYRARLGRFEGQPAGDHRRRPQDHDSPRHAGRPAHARRPAAVLMATRESARPLLSFRGAAQRRTRNP